MELSNVSFLSNNATNCITQVPQDIKLELSSGTLTLKAGSKVYVPNGFEENGTTTKFDEVIIENDIINVDLGTSTTDPDIWFVNTNSMTIAGWPSSICFSGSDKSTVPSTQIYAIYYETSTNKIWQRNNSTTWQNLNHCLPIGIGFNETTHTVDKIINIFNGATYCGSTIFILPGLKGLCPDGFDENGTNKNKEIVSTKMIIDTLSPNTNWNGHMFYYGLRPNNVADPYLETQITYSTPSSTYTGFYFNKIDNKWYWYTSGVNGGQIYSVFGINFYVSSTTSALTISNFNPPKVYQAESKEDFTEDYSYQETYTGKRWIDGKPIYRKVIQGTLNSEKKCIVNVASLKIAQFVSVWWCNNQGMGNVPWLSHYSSSTDFCRAYYTGNNTSLNFIYGSAYAQGDVITVVLEYTKTTD